MDSILTQLITLTTPGPLTYVVLIFYTILYTITYIVGIENIRQYFSLKIQSLKREVDETTIVEVEKKVLLKELQERLDYLADICDNYGGGQLVADCQILDKVSKSFFEKEHHLREIIATNRSLYLQKKLENSKTKKENCKENE